MAKNAPLPGSRLRRFRFSIAAAIIAALLPVRACAQDKLQWTTNYYSVTGDTLAEIHHSLRQGRPWKDKFHGDGLTDWRVDWRFSLAESADGCRIRQFTTTTTITITLPRWTASTNAPPNVRKAWERYIAALGQHEAGHAQFGLAAAAEMQKGMKSTGLEPACETLKEKINGLCQRIVEDYKKRDKDYDQRTDHGVTQGARLLFRTRPER